MKFRELFKGAAYLLAGVVWVAALALVAMTLGMVSTMMTNDPKPLVDRVVAPVAASPDKN